MPAVPYLHSIYVRKLRSSFLQTNLLKVQQVIINYFADDFLIVNAKI